MNTAKKIYQSDAQGFVHVDVSVGTPDRRIEVLVVWQDAEEVQVASTPDEDWSDLFGILRGVALERPPQGEYEKRDSLG